MKNLLYIAVTVLIGAILVILLPVMFHVTMFGAILTAGFLVLTFLPSKEKKQNNTVAETVTDGIGV